MERFAAPWGMILRLTTVFGVVLCLGVPLFGQRVAGAMPWGARLLLLGLPPLLLVGMAPFVVRGYRLGAGRLEIERLGWATRVPLAGLREVRVDPGAMRGSIRLFGNGGLFAFTGWYRNRQLGVYRVFGTKPDAAVVLRFAGRTVVVTPGDPEQFARVARAEAGLPEPPAGSGS